MAIVVYRCDVCKRTLELPRNVDGLERIQRCTITQGCRGRLYQTQLLPDYIRGGIPDDVSGLDNWVQRKVLHNHEQVIERAEWTIVHNMGIYPIVTVFVNRPLEGNLDNQEEITPDDIVIVDDNTVKLVFSRPYSGIAQLIGRQSDPDILQPYERVAESVVAPVQLSYNGEITIATRINTLGDDVSMPFNVLFNTTTGTNPTITYTVDDQPTLNSPWLDYDKVVIKGKIYTVRSFSGLVTEMTTGVINSGASFRFVSVDHDNNTVFRDIEPGEVLILLASDPYQIVDKQRDRFIDVTSVTATVNPFSLYYDTGEFFAEQKIVQTVYPYIRPV